MVSRPEGISSSSASNRRSCNIQCKVWVDFLSKLNLVGVGVSSGCSDNLVDHSLVAVEQPEEEVNGEQGEVEGEEEQPLEQEGGQGDEDAGGADVEVDHESQPGVVALHRVGGEAEEEGEGEHQEQRHHQELHEVLATLHRELLGLLLWRGRHLGRSVATWRLLGTSRGLLLVKQLILVGLSPLLALASATWLPGLLLGGCNGCRRGGGITRRHPSPSVSQHQLIEFLEVLGELSFVWTSICISRIMCFIFVRMSVLYFSNLKDIFYHSFIFFFCLKATIS